MHEITFLSMTLLFRWELKGLKTKIHFSYNDIFFLFLSFYQKYYILCKSEIFFSGKFESYSVYLVTLS